MKGRVIFFYYFIMLLVFNCSDSSEELNTPVDYFGGNYCYYSLILQNTVCYDLVKDSIIVSISSGFDSLATFKTINKFSELNFERQISGPSFHQETYGKDRLFVCSLRASHNPIIFSKLVSFDPNVKYAIPIFIDNGVSIYMDNVIVLEIRADVEVIDLLSLFTKYDLIIEDYLPPIHSISIYLNAAIKYNPLEICKILNGYPDYFISVVNNVYGRFERR
ncbi:hypothetical protein ACFLT7_04715 [candidate division KSB1 bacterium]